jgi:hypothetical protein
MERMQEQEAEKNAPETKLYERSFFALQPTAAARISVTLFGSVYGS